MVYVNQLAGELGNALVYTPSLRDLIREAVSTLPSPIPRIVDIAVNIASHAMRRLARPRIAILMDDAFQAIGVDRAERLVKALLNLIEWPPAPYDRIVVLVASGEWVTRERIGRHSWATFRTLWNMSRQGFEQLRGTARQQAELRRSLAMDRRKPEDAGEAIRNPVDLLKPLYAAR